MKLNNNTRKFIDDLARRMSRLPSYNIDNNDDYGDDFIINNNNINSKDDVVVDEFSDLDSEDEWYEELARHGYVAQEDICNPSNSDRIWHLYEAWIKDRQA